MLLNWQSMFPSRKQVSRMYQPQEAENKIGFKNDLVQGVNVRDANGW